jgi:hypothetical protein
MGFNLAFKGLNEINFPLKGTKSLHLSTPVENTLK